MLYTAVQSGAPAAVRYPRGQGTGMQIEREMQALPIGKAQVQREGRSGLCILAWGPMVGFCVNVAEKLDATLVNMRFIKPLDEELLLKLAARHKAFITVEENTVAGGAGSAVSEFLNSQGIVKPMQHLGIPDQFIEHGSRQDCLLAAGLDIQSITTTISQWWPAPALAAGG
jgi:1-deoxy-D-xylulose-5-phosphate synthase